MYAVYLFRALTNNISSVVDAFHHWIDERGDSNNWYNLICAVNSNGDFASFSTDVDYSWLTTRTLDIFNDEPTPEYIASRLKGELTVRDLKKLAWKICIYDVVDLYTTIMSMAKNIKSGEPFREFLSENLKKFKFNSNRCLARQFIKTFKHLVLEVEMELGRTISVTENILLNYTVTKLFKLYEVLSLETKTLPFITYGTPYDYRCFEISHLLDVKNKKKETILVVDIHI